MNYHILYFGLLAERRGMADERIVSSASTPRVLYAELDAKHQLGLSVNDFRVAVNDEFVSWDDLLSDHSSVAFLPPMSGG
jgi:sulfur-carrier protein